MIFLFCLFLSNQAGATETVVVTATKIATPESNIASSTTALDSQDLASEPVDNTAELLQSLPGTQIRSSGGLGQSQSLYLRGGNAEHTLILIDGITANEPMSATGAFDLAHVDPGSWGQIEIVRGPQSGLYGSSAMGGVVNFLSPTPRKGEPEFLLATEAGHYDTRRYQARWAKRYHSGTGYLNLHRETTLGFSTANEIYGNRESDGYRRNGIDGKVTKDLDSSNQVSLIAHYLDGRSDLDLQGGQNGDSSKFQGRSRALLSRAEWKNSGEANSVKAGFSFTDHRRDYKDPNYFYNSNLYKLDAEDDIIIDEANTLSFGLDFQDERGHSFDIPDTKSESTTGVYAQHLVQSKNIYFHAVTLRHDWFKRFEEQTTFRVAPGLKLWQDQTTLRASFGTAFKAPSLYQIYSNYGSLTIQPEKSKAWDLGFEQQLGSPQVTASLTYFEQRYRDLLSFDSVTLRSINVNAAHVHGWEGSLQAKPEAWNLQFSTTRLFSYNDTSGRKLIRRPDWSGKLLIAHTIGKDSLVSLMDNYVGQREDTDPTSFAFKTMPSYHVLGLNAETQITRVWNLGLRLENALDKQYEDVAGYGTEGRSLYVRVQASL